MWVVETILLCTDSESRFNSGHFWSHPEREPHGRIVHPQDPTGTEAPTAVGRSVGQPLILTHHLGPVYQ